MIYKTFDIFFSFSLSLGLSLFFFSFVNRFRTWVIVSNPNPTRSSPETRRRPELPVAGCLAMVLLQHKAKEAADMCRDAAVLDGRMEAARTQQKRPAHANRSSGVRSERLACPPLCRRIKFPPHTPLAPRRRHSHRVRPNTAGHLCQTESPTVMISGLWWFCSLVDPSLRSLLYLPHSPALSAPSKNVDEEAVVFLFWTRDLFFHKRFNRLLYGPNVCSGDRFAANGSAMLFLMSTWLFLDGLLHPQRPNGLSASFAYTCGREENEGECCSYVTVED